MGETKVTEKFQITVPKDVREAVGLRAGETVIVEAVGENELRVKRFRVIKDPLRVLIGKKRVFKRPVPIEELERKIEETE
jgi:AbrB family looped-hinge helix DNA binding protein